MAYIKKDHTKQKKERYKKWEKIRKKKELP